MYKLQYPVTDELKDIDLLSNYQLANPAFNLTSSVG